MKVGVIGSRTITDYSLVSNKLNILNDYLRITNIVSGGASGIDTIGRNYAINNNINLIEFLADWDNVGKAAGFIRNYDIVKNSELVLAFITDKSIGTMHSISLCHKHFINVIVFDTSGKIDKNLSKIYRSVKYRYKYARRVNKGESYYEVSSKGNKEYSALYAKIKDKSIEEIYQLDIKGYRNTIKDWKQAKGKPSLIERTMDEQYKLYKNLWYLYFKNNPNLYLNILNKGKDTTITDMFGNTEINQARAICDLCNSGLFKE